MMLRHARAMLKVSLTPKRFVHTAFAEPIISFRRHLQTAEQEAQTSGYRRYGRTQSCSSVPSDRQAIQDLINEPITRGCSNDAGTPVSRDETPD